MNILKNFLIAALVWGGLIYSSELSEAGGKMGDEKSFGPDVSWRQLIFQGSKFLNTINVNIELSSGGQLSGDLATRFGEDFRDCLETESDSRTLTVHFSTAGSAFSENRYQESIRFNEAAAHPEKRIRVSNGGDPWVKYYCWEEKGVRRKKILPANSDEKKHSLVEWTKSTESFYEYPEEVARCGTVSDPALVFYILSTRYSDNQQLPFEICVFGRKQLHRLTIGREKTSPLTVSYRKRFSSRDVAVDEKITPHIYTISSRLLATDSREPETFTFLGLHKDIRIYMDPEKRLPVRISGTNNKLGKLVLDLMAYSE